MIESYLMWAAHTPRTWMRRHQLARELRLVSKTYKLKKGAALRRWAVLCLATRAPTTVISYFRTAVSLWIGGRGQESKRTRAFRQGLETLYGTRPWNQPLPSLTPEEVAVMTEDMKMPLWFRIRLEVEYMTISRDADLTYVTWTDISTDQQQREITINFRFLKNNSSGTMGVLKVLRPRNWAHWLMYEALRRPASDLTARKTRAFPEEYEAFLSQLRAASPRPVGTRALRRGAAQAATAVATPQELQGLLAHRDVGTQRTYTGKLTIEEVVAQRRIQRHLNPPAKQQMSKHQQPRTNSTLAKSSPPPLRLNSIIMMPLEPGDADVGSSLRAPATTQWRGQCRAMSQWRPLEPVTVEQAEMYVAAMRAASVAPSPPSAETDVDSTSSPPH